MRHNQVTLSAAPHESVDEPSLSLAKSVAVVSMIGENIRQSNTWRRLGYLRRLARLSYITVVVMLTETTGRSRRVFVMMVTPPAMIMLIRFQPWRQIPPRMLRVLLTSGVVWRAVGPKFIGSSQKTLMPTSLTVVSVRLVALPRRKSRSNKPSLS